ncbi:MAG: nucleotidyltransferase domain-containing protein [Propionibacteriaceae bacterium]|nr:nucleotidyltransferase domain-containing protein [Propionibacteriaceae bacterium]
MYFGEPFGGLLPGAQGAVLAVLLRTGTPLTGRQIHGLVQPSYSTWSIQQAIKTLLQLGLIDATPAGRAYLHSVNQQHFAVAPLRALLNPIAALRAVVAANVDDQVHTVLLFGSVARGEATTQSDVDLAVIAEDDWQGRVDLQSAVTEQLGNDCDVLVLTQDDWANSKESVVSDMRRDGVVLYGAKPSSTKR